LALVNTIHSAIAGAASFNPLDATDWLRLFGKFAVYGVWFILFAETGLLAGFFLPGDSLLFVAGVFASDFLSGQGFQLNIWALLIGGPIFAVLGAQTGHWLGARYGRKLFDKPNSRLFKQEYVHKAEHYFQKFGPRRAVVLARFIPIVRTFMNPVAGVLGMPAKQFLVWNTVGAVLWVDGVLLAGYLLAEQIINAIGGPEQIDKYIVPFVLLIVLISAIPIFVEIIRERRAKRRARRSQSEFV
jgi:membrane-associated protein